MRLDHATLLVLAGGAGRRLGGGDKALVPVGGRPMIAWVLDLAPRFVAAAIVAPPSVEHAAFGVPVIADRGPGDGAPAALATGLEACTSEWAVVLACDMPLVDPAVLDRLAAEAGDDVDAVVPEADGRVHPLHGVYRATVADPARAIAAEGASLQALLARIRTRFVPLDDPASVSNVNTPADLAAAEAVLRRR